MVTLYNCRKAGDQFRVTKFDDGMNVESSYLCTETKCECPAGVRPSCRHREMLPKFIQRQHIGDEWFFDFDRGGWVQQGMEWAEQGISQDNREPPHGPEVKTADFDSADGGSIPPVAANITATEIDERMANISGPTNKIIEDIVDSTFEAVTKPKALYIRRRI